jgi:uncharacterized Zn finger protein (UPF0148 family)
MSKNGDGTFCPSCKAQIVSDNGRFVCTDCGLTSECWADEISHGHPDRRLVEQMVDAALSGR